VAMALPSTVSNCVDSKQDIAIGVLSQGPRRALSVEDTASARGGRGHAHATSVAHRDIDLLTTSPQIQAWTRSKS
jgi:electron transfer flavoprotein alpha/beta subunit